MINRVTEDSLHLPQSSKLIYSTELKLRNLMLERKIFFGI